MYGLSLLVAFGMGFGACIFMGPLRCLQCQCDATGGAATSPEVPTTSSSAAAELAVYKALELFGKQRPWSGVTFKNVHPRWTDLTMNYPHKMQFTLDGAMLWNSGPLNETPEQKNNVDGKTYPDQVASKKIYHMLSFEGTRPVWDKPLMDEFDRMKESGETFSCPHYPHSAEDVLLACETFAEPIKGGEWAVWSSISPWVEATLLRFGVEEVTTVDYNEPKVVDVPQLKTFGQAGIAKAYAEGKIGFDGIVSFSGLEHDGLGRYGDPVNPFGDFSAMREIWLCLKPGGLLLLAVPTAAQGNIQFPFHRIYGPERVRPLIECFEMVGRVWDGKSVKGGLEKSDVDPPLFVTLDSRNTTGVIFDARLGKAMESWQHQQVLVLRKPTDAGMECPLNVRGAWTSSPLESYEVDQDRKTKTGDRRRPEDPEARRRRGR